MPVGDMMQMNRGWALARRPSGLPSRDDFAWQELPRPTIRSGEFLVRNRWLSCDAAQRAWMEFDTYIPALPLGNVMASATAGEVIDSMNPDYALGDIVTGMFGWQEYAVSDGSPFGGLLPPTKIPPGVDMTTALSLLGVTGITAYFGLLDIGRPGPGETVVVSGAAGGVGSIVCQIAKLRGCRVVGIAGGGRKCDWLRNRLGVDEALDHREGDLERRVAEACPDGIHVFFDNVGGAPLDAALVNMAVGGRVVLCGAVASYQLKDRPSITNHVNLIVQRCTMQGFLVFDYADRYAEAVARLARWAAAGKIVNHIDVLDGLERAPDGLRRLCAGENLGKQLVQLLD